MDDKAWLKNIYDDYQNLVYKIAVSIIKDAQLAEDIMQEVFVTLYFKADSIRDKNKIKPWLTRTTVNRSIDYTRKAKKAVILPVDSFEDFESNPWSDPVIELNEKELILEIQKAIDTLPAELKASIIFYYFLEMPQKEIAEILELPVGTVKTRLSRARAALKKRLLKDKQEIINLSSGEGVS